MDDAQTFEDWTKQHELSDTTVKTLQDNGFDSIQSCKLLNTAMIQKHFAKSLTLGQTLLLQNAVEFQSKAPSVGPDAIVPQANSVTTAKDTTSSAAANAPTALASNLDSTLQQQGLDAASLLNLISANRPASENISMSDGRGLTFDPFNCNSGNISKLYDIRDFVTVMPTERKEGAPIKVGDMELNLIDTKPKLDTITQMQYMEASLRILREMAVKDGASLPQVLQYVGYLIKIANMGQRFQWKSVLKYDAEYRKTQAEAGFPYGADSSFMMQLFLRDRLPQDQNIPRPSAVSSTQHPQTKFDPQSGKPICGQFNSSKGCQLQCCKFAHVCRACYDPHSFVSHKEHASTTQAN